MVQGLCRMVKDQLTEPKAAVRLWVHECERVLADRLINEADLAKFQDMRVNATKKYFDDVPMVSPASHEWHNGTLPGCRALHSFASEVTIFMQPETCICRASCLAWYLSVFSIICAIHANADML